jgi:hypothetical protein
MYDHMAEREKVQALLRGLREVLGVDDDVALEMAISLEHSSLRLPKHYQDFELESAIRVLAILLTLPEGDPLTVVRHQPGSMADDRHYTITYSRTREGT